MGSWPTHLRALVQVCSLLPTRDTLEEREAGQATVTAAPSQEEEG